MSYTLVDHCMTPFSPIDEIKVAGYNKRGWGHTVDYYRAANYLAGTEVFANLLSLLDEGNVFWKRVLERLVPENLRRRVADMTPIMDRIGQTLMEGSRERWIGAIGI